MNKLIELPKPVEAVDFMKMKFKAPPKLVKHTKNWITIRTGPKEGWNYPIEGNRIDTPEKVLGWLHHLTKKGWFTDEHVQQLIEIAEKRGVKVDWHC